MIACIEYLVTGNIIVRCYCVGRVSLSFCALVSATPTAVMAAYWSKATKLMALLLNLVKFLKLWERVDTMAFDKTGLLTRGQLSVQSILAVDTDIVGLIFFSELHL